MMPNETNEENQALGQTEQVMPVQLDNNTHMEQPSPPRPSETGLAELNELEFPPLHPTPTQPHAGGQKPTT